MIKLKGVKEGARELKANLKDGVQELGERFSSLFAASFRQPDGLRMDSLVPVEAYKPQAFVMAHQKQVGQRVY
jgi:hypothetical protein